MLYWYLNKEKIEQMDLDQPPRMRYAVYFTKDFKTGEYRSSGQLREFCEKAFSMMYRNEAGNPSEHYILVDWTPGEPEIDWPVAKATAKAADDSSADVLDDSIPSAPLTPSRADDERAATLRAIGIAISPKRRHKLN
jgi:hypothetical protein